MILDWRRKSEKRKAVKLAEITTELGPLVRDLLEALFQERVTTESIYRLWLRELPLSLKKNPYQSHRKAWGIRVAVDLIRGKLHSRSEIQKRPFDLVKLETEGTPEERLSSLLLFMERLRVEEQLVLAMLYRLQLKPIEIAAILSTSEGSVDLIARQALDQLSLNVWGDPPSKAQSSSLKTTLQATSLPIADPVMTSGAFVSNSWMKRSRWLRSSLESIGVGAAILLVIALAPKLKDLYERQLERRLLAFDLSDFSESAKSPKIAADTSEASNDSNPMPAECALFSDETSEGCQTMSTDNGAIRLDAEVAEEEDSEEKLAEPEEEEDRQIASGEGQVQEERAPDLKIGNAEIWRFNVKTDSPEDLREIVREFLGSMPETKNIPGSSGIKAPGGIQFSLMVPRTVVSKIKDKMSQLASSHDSTTDHSTQKFTWYRNRYRGDRTNKSVPPEGQTRVVIWLSQM